jgi:hypothetical protein
MGLQLSRLVPAIKMASSSMTGTSASVEGYPRRHILDYLHQESPGGCGMPAIGGRGYVGT